MTVTEILITLGAIAISWFVLRWLITVLKVTLGTAIKIALIVFLLQLFFGIGPIACGSKHSFYGHRWRVICRCLLCPPRNNDRFLRRLSFGGRLLSDRPESSKLTGIKPLCPKVMTQTAWLELVKSVSEQGVQLPASGLKIGRAPDNDIVLNDLSVSRYHAFLEWQEGKVHLVDLGSKAGTHLNGQPGCA